MKALDAITNPAATLKRHTWFGGLLTVFLIFVGIALFVNELSNYKEKEITKNMFLDMDIDSERVLVNFNIQLFSAPCVIVSLDIHDSLNHHTADVPLQKLKFDRATQTQKPYMKPTDPEAKLAELIEDLNSGMGCVLVGEFLLDKVSGDFHISFHSEMELFSKLRAFHRPEFEKLNLSYQIKALSFGRKENDLEMDKIRRLADELELSDQLLANYIEFKPITLDHFIAAFWIEIIPYTLKDNRNGYSYRSYQNSFNSRIKPLMGAEREQEIPILEFRYKFSALSAKYEIHAGSYKHILGTALILLGGVYMFFNVLNSVGLALIRWKGLDQD